MAILFSGTNLTGFATDDFIFGHPSAGPHHIIDGGGGDDLIFGDYDFFFSGGGTDAATAVNITNNTLPWSTYLNVDIANSESVPHASIYIEPTAGTTRFYAVTVVAGAQITLDVDYGSHQIGGSTDSMLRILDTDGVTQLAFSDDSSTLDGGLGSASGFDSFLQFTFATAGTYFIEVAEFSQFSTFEGDETLILNVSLTGQTTTNTDPVTGDDTITGGDGNDVIHGGDGFDTINGGNDSDTIVDRFANAVNGGAGNDLIINTFVNGGTWDGGADIDTLDTSRDIFSGQTYDLSAASFGMLGATFLNFENIIDNNGANTIIGSDGANVLTPNFGADTVDARGGNDRIVDTDGLNGDSYNGGADTDTLDYSGAPIVNGTEFNFLTGVVSRGSSTDTFANIEVLQASNADDIIRSDGSGQYFARGGNDLVFAGIGASESLDGGAGIDTLDTTSFNGNYTINLTTGLTNFAGESFTDFENVISGNGNDTLTGTNQANVINGGGGDDAMSGGIGNDVYFVDSVLDITNENPGEGTDGVVSSVSFLLAANVENLQLTGSANIDAAGNNDANRLIGNAGNNILNGMGGVDFMQGLGGNDVYWVDSLGESVVEAAGQGIDGVVSTITYTLPVNVENLQIIGSANINATGNALDNRLIGNAGNNVLNGLVGADIMQGLNGNDVYWVDNAGDSIIETSLAGSGIDGVITSVNYTLAVNVENLSLGGASTIGVGNASNNTITGNGLNNVINGMLGYDVLIGGGGDDKFIMNTSITGGPNFDYLKDFNDAGNDEIRLENAIFTALTSTGFLAANLFKDIGSGAQDADDVILYNSTTGALYYDANGLAAGGLTQFAVVDVGTTVTAADFFVI